MLKLICIFCSESKKVCTLITFVTGVNPREIRGTKTGVYVGLMTTEATDYFERVPEKLTGYETIGAVRSMLANRISFQYDFKGMDRLYSTIFVLKFKL